MLTQLAEVERIRPLTVPINSGCDVLGIGRSKLYELARKNEVEIIEVGGRSVVVVASMEAYVERAREAAAAKRRAA